MVDFTLKSIGYILVGSKEEMSKETMRLAEDFIERTMGLTVYEFVLLVKGELKPGVASRR